MLKIRYQNRFKKDYKKMLKRGRDMRLLAQLVTLLCSGEPLPEKCRDHPLSGNYLGYRECHIQPDWLLIYKIDRHTLTLVLTRTGTHGDLF